VAPRRGTVLALVGAVLSLAGPSSGGILDRPLGLLHDGFRAGFMEEHPFPAEACAAAALPGCPAWSLPRGGSYDEPLAALPDGDGVVHVVHGYEATGRYVLVQRVDNDGAVVWTADPGHPSAYMWDLAVAGDLVLLGGSTSGRSADGRWTEWPLVVALRASDGTEHWAWSGKTEGEAGRVFDIAEVPDADLVAITGYLHGSRVTGFTAVHDATTGERRWVALHDRAAVTLGRVVAADGGFVVTGFEAYPPAASSRLFVEARTAAGGAPLWTSGYPLPSWEERIRTITLAPRAGMVVVGGAAARVPTHTFLAGFDLADGRPWWVLEGNPGTGEWSHLSTHPDGRMVVAVGWEGSSTAEACRLEAFTPHGDQLWNRTIDGDGNGRCYSGAFTPGGDRFLVGASVLQHDALEVAALWLDASTGWTQWAGYVGTPHRSHHVHQTTLTDGGRLAVLSGVGPALWAFHGGSLPPEPGGATGPVGRGPTPSSPFITDGP
jgi:hypothetical protein